MVERYTQRRFQPVRNLFFPTFAVVNLRQHISWPAMCSALLNGTPHSEMTASNIRKGFIRLNT